MGRGQFIGEMSMFTDQPRTATVVAIRDTVLARLDKADFPALLEASARASIVFTRHIITRLMTGSRRPSQVRPVTIGLVPVSAGVSMPSLASSLMAAMAAYGRVCLVDETGIVARSHHQHDEATAVEATTTALSPPPSPASSHPTGPLADGPPPRGEVRGNYALDDIEAAHDFVLLVAHPDPDAWTAHCLRQADEILLLADATQPAALHPNESLLAAGATSDTGAAEVLVLLHPDGTRAPTGTAAWLDRRPVADHLHIRPGLPRDVARLARIVTRNAVGLVLSGGGARGMSHLGVWRALHERGIDVDYVGGTSIGSIMTALIAADQPLDELKDIAEEALQSNPTGDVNPLPVISHPAARPMSRTCGRTPSW
jgi:NTE family protein